MLTTLVALLTFLGYFQALPWPNGASAANISPNVRVTSAVQLNEGSPDLAVWGDRLVAVWHRNIERSKAGWGYSLDGGQSWVDGGAFPIPTPTAQQILRGQPSICVTASGEFFAAVAFSMSPPFSKTIAVYRGVFEGDTFAWGPPRFAYPFFSEGGLVYEAPQIACDAVQGHVYLSCTRTARLAADSFVSAIQFVRSVDSGLTWSQPTVLSSMKCTGSQPVVGPDGEVYVVWEDFEARQLLGRRSADFGQTFDPAFIVSPIQDNLASGPPGYCPTASRVNSLYGACSGLFGPSFPAVGIDHGSGPGRGNLYVAWAEAASGAVLSPNPASILEVEPNDHFATAMPVTLGLNVGGFEASSDRGGGGDDFYAMDLAAGTTMWIEGSIVSTFPTPLPDSPQCLFTTLFCGADTIAATSLGNIFLGEDTHGPMPPLIFTAPATGRYYLHLYFSGPYSYQYQLCFRELVPEPSSAARDHRDIVLVSSANGGANWSPKTRVNDDPPRFDNSLADLAVDELGRVHVAWYDRRTDPVCGEVTHTQLATSDNAGATFGESCTVSEEAGSWQVLLTTSDSDIGDRLALATSGPRVHALWTQTGRPDLDIYAAVIRFPPTPLALVQDFSAAITREQIAVTWRITDSSQILRLQLYRGTNAADFSLVGDWPAEPDKRDFAFLDPSVFESATYHYRLLVLLRDGTQTWIGPAAVSFHSEAGLKWQMAAPNPFNSAITFELRSDFGGPAYVRIFDVMGREVVTLFRGLLAVGVTSYIWDGHNAQGMPMPGGTYFVEAGAEGRRTVHKIVRHE